MHFSKGLEVLIVLGLCVSYALSASVKPVKQPKCRGKEMHVNDKDMKGIEDCVKEITPETKTSGGDDLGNATKAISKEKMACLGKCILKNEGLIDDKGMPSKNNLMEKLNSTMPEEVLEEMDNAIAKCVDEHGKNVDPMEKTCQSYQPLTQCMTMAFVQVCKEEEDKKH